MLYVLCGQPRGSVLRMGSICCFNHLVIDFVPWRLRAKALQAALLALLSPTMCCSCSSGPVTAEPARVAARPLGRRLVNRSIRPRGARTGGQFAQDYAASSDKISVSELLDRPGLSAKDCMAALSQFGRQQEWQLAIDLLGRMSSRRVEADKFFFNKLISICSWEEALHVLDSMRSRGMRPDVVSFNTTISACASSKKWAEALQLLEEGKKLPSGADPTTYGATINACEEHWELALHLLNEMSARKLELNEVISASTIRACSNGDNPEAAIELLRALQQQAVRQNVRTYTCAMAACHRDQFLWPWSLWLLSEMKDEGLEMDIGLFNAAMGVCRISHGFGHLRKRNMGQVEQLFKDVRYHRLNPDIITYSHVMAAVREAGEWEQALEVLDEALSSNLRPDSQLYTNAIAACADAASWQSAMHLLGYATAVGPSEHHWSAAMTACSDATQWQYALLLASEMTDIGLSAGIVSYTAMMSACTHGGMWQNTLRLLDMLQAAGEAPNYVTMTAVIKACITNTNWTFALHWKSILDKLGVSGYFTTYTYLIGLCAEAEQWNWVEYLMAESNVRFPSAENFDQRQASEDEDPSLMISDAAASQRLACQCSRRGDYRNPRRGMASRCPAGSFAGQGPSASTQCLCAATPGCSHVFHGECLRSFERFSGKQYCPLCRCPYFDATIHYSGLMVWRKKCASRIQRAWRGYRSRGEIFLQLRQPQLRAEAPTLHRRFCGKALQALGGKLEKAHEDALDRFLQELDGSVASSSAQIRDGLRDFEQLHFGPGSSVAGPLAESAVTEAAQEDVPSCSDGQAEGKQRWAIARQKALSLLPTWPPLLVSPTLGSIRILHVPLSQGPVCRQSYERRPWNFQEGERPPRPPGRPRGAAKAKPAQDMNRGIRQVARRGASESRFLDYRFYNLVHLKCLKLGDCSQALGFWKDCRAAGISSCNALLATCEVAMDWDEWVDGCGKLGPTGWVMARSSVSSCRFVNSEILHAAWYPLVRAFARNFRLKDASIRY
eukprot:s165_g38.t2